MTDASCIPARSPKPPRSEARWMLYPPDLAKRILAEPLDSTLSIGEHERRWYRQGLRFVFKKPSKIDSLPVSLRGKISPSPALSRALVALVEGRL